MECFEKIDIFFKGRKFPLRVRNVSYFGRIRGLMFKKKDSDALLFDFSKECREPIHSFFVFFPFLALWLNEKNEVLEYKVVRPFALRVKSVNFYKLIEIPLETKDLNSREIIEFLVGKERFKYN